MNKINIDWLKEPNFDDTYYTRVHILKNGKPFGYTIITRWMDEDDVLKIEEGQDRWLELNRYYSPSFARSLNYYKSHIELVERLNKWTKNNGFTRRW